MQKLNDENIIQNNGKEGMGESFSIVNCEQETLPDTKRNVQEDTNPDSLEVQRAINQVNVNDNASCTDKKKC